MKEHHLLPIAITLVIVMATVVLIGGNMGVGSVHKGPDPVAFLSGLQTIADSFGR